MKKIKKFVVLCAFLLSTFSTVEKVRCETVLSGDIFVEAELRVSGATSAAPLVFNQRLYTEKSNIYPFDLIVFNYLPSGADDVTLQAKNVGYITAPPRHITGNTQHNWGATVTIGDVRGIEKIRVSGGTGSPYIKSFDFHPSSGDVINLEATGYSFSNGANAGSAYRVLLNGNELISAATTPWVTNVMSGNPKLEVYYRRPTYVNPILTVEDVRCGLTSNVDWFADTVATYGHTTSKVIPDDGGTLEDTTIGGPNNTDDRLSSDGLTYDQIGAYIHSYTARDADYYDTTVPFYDEDDTETTASRKISVYTTDAPDLNISYGSNADSLLIGQPYDANAVVALPCGGEDGWTNKPLKIQVDPNAIPGNFDTVLREPTAAATTVANGIATFDNYDIQTPVAGTTVEGILTERDDATNLLSSLVSGKVKIDTTLPIPNASHQGGISFTDLSDDAPNGSGKSSTRPSLIALVPAGTVTPPEKTDATSFDPDDIGPKDPGLYDVYVWAFDKAGNEAVEMVGAYEIDGEVIIKKDTDKGATLHSVDCSNSASIEKEIGCTSNCIEGATQGIVENDTFAYHLTIENTDTTKLATGTFTDFLPKGFSITTAPTLPPVSGISGLGATLMTSGANSGQWRITGTYNIPATESRQVSINVTAPKHADIADPTKVLSNQAMLTWNIGSKSGTATSNYANHEITASPSVETKFKKVGADDTATGITGAKFALYQWIGSDGDYTTHQGDILDATDPDGGQANGLWKRVKKDAVDGTTADFFDTDALGEVVLGELPTGVYTLIETKSPTGYELPVGQWTIEVDASNTDSGNGDWKIEYKAKSDSTLPPAVIRVPGSAGNPPTYRIVNTKPFSVGMTGMNGTAGYISLGLGLMVMAGIIYSVHQRKKRNQGKDSTAQDEHSI